MLLDPVVCKNTGSSNPVVASFLNVVSQIIVKQRLRGKLCWLVLVPENVSTLAGARTTVQCRLCSSRNTMGIFRIYV
jgi:hypothetical protein